MKVLLIDAMSSFLDFALRCEAEGHEVRVFVGPLKNGDRSTIGDGLFTRVSSWEAHMKWADLIVVSDNAKYTTALEPYRLKGYPIFGPNIETTAWELNREMGQEVLRSAGIETIPSVPFKRYQEAIEFVSRNLDKRYVCKPNGDVSKALSYVSKSGEDMIFMLQHWMKEGAAKDTFILQEFHGGIEMAVGGWFGKSGFSKYFLENFEHKKLMNDDKGCNTGESGTCMRYVTDSLLAEEMLLPLEGELYRQGYTGYIDVAVIIDKKGKVWPLEFTCYDEETEVLTADGWKHFSQVNVGDMVHSLNPSTGIAEMQPVSDVICKPYDGEMIHFKSDSYGSDLMVTPDHSMYARNANKDSFEFVQAKDIANRGTMWQVLRSAEFEGVEQKFFTLPEYVETHKTGRHKGEFEIVHPAVSIDMDVWLSFLGYYISEGSTNGYQVAISQHKYPHKDTMREMLEALPFHVGELPVGFSISSIQLTTWVKENIPGICNEKRIPREFMGLSSRQLNILLDALILGDGSVHKNSGQRTYYTTSKGLADDVSELITKVGHLARIVKNEVAGTTMSVRGGKEYTRNWDSYVVSEKTQKKTSWLDRRNTDIIQYRGNVYCLNVPPHHLLYVRRNGNATWCGNCRPGWPLFQIQQQLHPDTCEWMLDLINGTDSFKPSSKVAIGVVIGIPPYPFEAATQKELSGYPVWGITEKNRKWIHPTEMMLGQAPHKEGNKIKILPCMVSSGSNLMTVTGVGDSVTEAKDRCYKTVDELIVPNSPMYRTDIGSRVIKQLPDLQKLGYATEWTI